MNGVTIAADYDSRTSSLTLMAHLLVSDTLQTAAQSATFSVHQLNGTEILAATTDSAPTSQGVFSTSATVTIQSGTNYVITVAITAEDDTVYTNVIYMTADR